MNKKKTSLGRDTHLWVSFSSVWLEFNPPPVICPSHTPAVKPAHWHTSPAHRVEEVHGVALNHKLYCRSRSISTQTAPIFLHEFFVHEYLTVFNCRSSLARVTLLVWELFFTFCGVNSKIRSVHRLTELPILFIHCTNTCICDGMLSLAARTKLYRPVSLLRLSSDPP